MITPVKIRKTGPKQLTIEWSDGKICDYSTVMLRKKCPCATCHADQQANGPTFIPLFSSAALELKNITPMGRYALQFHWGDGHNTGIYDYAYLRELCPDNP